MKFVVTLLALAGVAHGQASVGFMFSSCGSARYNPTQEFCCGDTVVPNARKDLLCCNDVIVNNPTGKLLCCNKQSYDPGREVCLNGVVLEYVNVDRTVYQRPTSRYSQLSQDGSIANFVGASPKGLADSKGVATREVDIPADPTQQATVRDVYGQDILNCNGKFHRLTDPSQYGYFACCGDDVYNWLYYTCVNNKVVMVQDAPWPQITRDASTDMKPITPEGKLFPPLPSLGNMPKAAPGLGKMKIPEFPGITALSAVPPAFQPPEGLYARCGSNRWFHMLNPSEKYQCCGDTLVDSAKFDCSPPGYSEPIVMMPGQKFIGFDDYRNAVFSGKNLGKFDSSPIIPLPINADLSPVSETRTAQPYCEHNKLKGAGNSMAYDCCGNSLYSTKTHFCCGSYIHERKSGQLCCNGVYADNSSGYISCCGRTPYDIRSYVCRLDQERQ